MQPLIDRHSRAPEQEGRWPHPLRRAVGASFCLALVMASGIVARSEGRAGQAPGSLNPGPIGYEDFVGAETCGECHASQFAAWSRSAHGLAGGSPGPGTVIAPFDGTPIRFRDAVVIPRVTDDSRYVFRVERPQRPAEVFEVDGVVGRGHMFGGGTQGFLSRFPDGTVRFLPFDYSRTAGVWFCNTTPISGQWSSTAALADLRPDRGWVPITPEMRLTECGDWPPIRVFGADATLPNCQSCHGSQITVRKDAVPGQRLTRIRSLSVNCESCHGPGKAHVEAARTGGGLADLRIGVLDTLDTDASMAVCFQCHALKHILAPDYLPGDDPASHYSLLLPLVGSRPFHPDGRVRTFAYQQGHRASACYLQGAMSCVDCHDPHGPAYRSTFGEALNGRFDDGQCTSCHPSKTAGRAAHTRHAPESAGSRCVACHMPYLQQPMLGDLIPYRRSDHTIPVPRPGEDDDLGVENACGTCHAERGAEALGREAQKWWGTLKPRHPAVQAVLDAMTRGLPPDLSLQPELRHPMAQVMALDYVLEEVAVAGPDGLRPGLIDALRRMSEARDVDVRSVSLAALHLIAGEDPSVRSLLAQTARAADSALIRPRWVLALGLTAESYRSRGNPVRAIVAYGKALEVDPNDLQTLLSLGYAFSTIGDDSAAVRFYERALAVDSAEPVAWVDLGLSLEHLGAATDAEAAYGRALELDPRAGLARMNLGNLMLRRGDATGAAAQYEQAVEGEPWLARANFYLAVARLQLGDEQGAAEALRAALEFAPNDPEILDLSRRVFR